MIGQGWKRGDARSWLALIGRTLDQWFPWSVLSWGVPSFGFEGAWGRRGSGGDGGEATPVPIPNTEVKLPSAHDTWRGTARESGSLPVLMEAFN